ncbi:hypothetical protein [Ruegeria atlantica]|uniref:Uncharacterized protein n=1 Tax=Ruegeria atlantica TaxID=81569 RepID=A0A0P1E5M9_9RHOB|nr:hypothetical protein [Ruegeria atlantica]CUH43946.1 hypothetical protein RUM4293_02843 [Ruegeria atlantica]
MEQEISDLTSRIKELQVQIARSQAEVEDARALNNLEHLPSDKAYIEEARGYLAILIDMITLMPDERAQHGLQAEMHLSSGAFLDGSVEDEAVTVPC